MTEVLSNQSSGKILIKMDYITPVKPITDKFNNNIDKNT